MIYSLNAQGGTIVRTKLDLPENLLIGAMKATHIKTKVIITALEESPASLNL